jgi:hypothetical protein
MMVLLPTVSLLPATLNAAAAVPPVVVNVALPRDVFPRVKFTVPAGRAEAVLAFTIAVTVVAAFWAMLGGLAAATVVVAAGARATVTVTEAVEPLKLLSPP